jgi:activator of HSP90 ATPase
MQIGRTQGRSLPNHDRRHKAQPARRRLRAFLPRVALLVLISGSAQAGQQNTSTPTSSSLTEHPQANDQMNAADTSQKLQDAPPANELRKKQLAQESDMLLTLAMALKAEVDKTNKDTLSLNVIRKADEIEKLAHNVKDKLR